MAIMLKNDAIVHTQQYILHTLWLTHMALINVINGKPHMVKFKEIIMLVYVYNTSGFKLKDFECLIFAVQRKLFT
jgi:hypothetical protein